MCSSENDFFRSPGPLGWAFNSLSAAWASQEGFVREASGPEDPVCCQRFAHARAEPVQRDFWPSPVACEEISHSEGS